NPDLPSVADALKTARIAREANKRIVGVVVNRVRRKAHELTKREVEEMLDLPVLAEIPEDNNIRKSIAVKKPVIEFAPFSPASIEIRRLAHTLCGIPFRQKEPFRFNIIEKLVSWMTR
ncbi:MAG: AAA family ATPase, partial [Candidatus Aenigmarchaeota archaeon]|nr:AAA family ATPase [Candidatus Aenigmarchaeota archaeon]